MEITKGSQDKDRYYFTNSNKWTDGLKWGRVVVFLTFLGSEMGWLPPCNPVSDVYLVPRVPTLLSIFLRLSIRLLGTCPMTSVKEFSLTY